jgi:hypothetical protein
MMASIEYLIVGLNEEVAKRWLEDIGMTMRVTDRDGEAISSSLEYDKDRLNVVIENGQVARCGIRG